jgi:hypothetical protein
MSRIVFAILLGWSGLAAAQMDVRTAKASQHNVSGLLSKAAGGWSVGVGYEYMYDGATGIGGHFRTFSKEEGPINIHNGFMIVGATLGHHFFKGKWDLAFTPSFNIISIDQAVEPKGTRTTPDDATTFGPGMSISLTWALTERVGLGFDYSNYWVWLEDDYAGQVISDMALKVKGSF